MTKKINLNLGGKKEVFAICDNNKDKDVETSDSKYCGPVDFETAITATERGKFYYILILTAAPAIISTTVATTTMSYVFPDAQCDLNLSLQDKGLLNSMSYVGMIISAMLWGFLGDTLGRRKLIIVGSLLTSFFVSVSIFSQSMICLMLSKFCEGVIVSGPCAVCISYVSEFQSAKHRAKTQIIIGVMLAFGTIVIPALAWLILPLNLEFSMFNGFFKFHSWNFYLLASATPSLSSGLLFIFMPESPKFLMTMGDNEKALKVMQLVYKINTGKPAESYPVKKLVDELKLRESEGNKHGGYVTPNRSKMQALREGFQQLKPLCFSPHLGKIVLVCGIEFCVMMGINTFRLWMPQLFQTVNDYKFNNNGSTASLCVMLETIKPSSNMTECVVNKENSSVYINAIAIGVCSTLVGLIAGNFISIIGKKTMLASLGLISGLLCFSIYFTKNSIEIFILIALFLSLSGVCVNVVLAVCVDLFPTTLRATSVSLTLMTGRMGPMIGNVLFPVLLKWGCFPPFFILGSALILPGILGILLLPNTEMKAMQ